MAYKQIAADYGLNHERPHLHAEVIIGTPQGDATHVYQACGDLAVARLLSQFPNSSSVVMTESCGIDSSSYMVGVESP